MSKIAIIYATQREAQPFIDRVKARLLPDTPFATYAFTHTKAAGNDDCQLVISEMGSDNASRATTYLQETFSPEVILNPGICGATGAEVQVGEIFCVTETRQNDSPLIDADTAATSPIYTCANTGFSALLIARLTTSPRPVFEPGSKAALARWSELVDMEGAAIAAQCTTQNTPCILIKGISDLADAAGKESIQENLDSVSLTIAETLIAGINTPEFTQRFTPEPPPPTPRAPSGFIATMKALLHFTRLEHTVFSLPLLFAGAWLGGGGELPNWRLLLLIILAATGARTFGMAINRLADRHLDAKNPRTKNRELPAGILTPTTASVVALTGLALYAVSCWFIGGWVLRLAILPLIPLAGYSFLKRFTPLCHFGIGICLAQAPLCAYLATTNSLTIPPQVWRLSLFTFLWLAGSDIVYAIMDMESDRANGIRSIPVRLGASGAQWTAGVLHLAAAVTAAAMLREAGGGLLGWTAFLIALICLALVQVRTIPLGTRFFPIAAIAGVAGAFVPIGGGIA